ncbi:hypothetical protein LIER_19394 [Lithospermum erythrorhizon]|uniref:Reverse transcriptase n=1 Tax=Lithospermum erythrorhizon TaxID=34254 RepID=A0AAV3QJ36_LITER
MDDFNESIRRLAILEHPFNGSLFTWCRNWDERSLLRRLDRAWNVEFKGNGLSMLSSKLKNVKVKLRGLNKKEFNNISCKVMEIQRELEYVQTKVFNGDLSLDLLKHIVTWLEEGDASTPFFHSRHKQEVKEEAVDFYKELFTAPRKDYVNYEEKLGEIIRKKLGANDDEVVEVVRTFFATSQMSKSQNSTTLVLIPKNECPQSINEFRSISCCNTIYKCITSIIVVRMKPVLDRIVGKQQTTFIPGRRISLRG